MSVVVALVSYLMQPKYKGFFHGVATIVKEEKIGGVYKGLVPTILKVSTAQATR
jgi:solute carrier family 25 citrate transporter 1